MFYFYKNVGGQIVVKLVLYISVSSIVFGFVFMNWFIGKFFWRGLVIDPSQLRKDVYKLTSLFLLL